MARTLRPLQEAYNREHTRREAIRLRALEREQRRAKMAAMGLYAELIEAGFRVMATKLHPDRGGSHEKMVELNEVRKHLHDVLGTMPAPKSRKTKKPKPRTRAERIDVAEAEAKQP